MMHRCQWNMSCVSHMINRVGKRVKTCMHTCNKAPEEQSLNILLIKIYFRKRHKKINLTVENKPHHYHNWSILALFLMFIGLLIDILIEFCLLLHLHELWKRNILRLNCIQRKIQSHLWKNSGLLIFVLLLQWHEFCKIECLLWLNI